MLYYSLYFYMRFLSSIFENRGGEITKMNFFNIIVVGIFFFIKYP